MYSLVTGISHTRFLQVYPKLNCPSFTILVQLFSLISYSMQNNKFSPDTIPILNYSVLKCKKKVFLNSLLSRNIYVI